MTTRKMRITLICGFLALALSATARADDGLAASGQLAQYAFACVGPVYSDGTIGVQFHAQAFNDDLRFRFYWSADGITYTRIYKTGDIVALGITVNPSTAPNYYPGYFQGCVQNYYYSNVGYYIWIGPVNSPYAWCPPTGIC
jgi:hypothetical protein